MTLRTMLFASLAFLMLSAPVYGQQVIGTFSWQTQPYCNVLTLTVIQQGAVYQLLGTDNLCGAGNAPVSGTAVPSAGGVAFGLTVSLSSGRASQISAAINLITLSGTWADADGNTGPLVFAGNSGGSPRPAPAASSSIMVNQFAASVYGGSGSATTLARSDHTHDDRYFTQSQLAGLSAAVSGGNGEGVGNTICTGTSNGVEVFIKNGLGTLVNARFSFIVPGFSHGQIRADGSIRTSTANLVSVQHPAAGQYCLVFSTSPGQTAAEATVVSIHAER
jgi:hypothetical protein